MILRTLVPTANQILPIALEGQDLDLMAEILDDLDPNNLAHCASIDYFLIRFGQAEASTSSRDSASEAQTDQAEKCLYGGQSANGLDRMGCHDYGIWTILP